MCIVKCQTAVVFVACGYTNGTVKAQDCPSLRSCSKFDRTGSLYRSSTATAETDRGEQRGSRGAELTDRTGTHVRNFAYLQEHNLYRFRLCDAGGSPASWPFTSGRARQQRLLELRHSPCWCSLLPYDPAVSKIYLARPTDSVLEGRTSQIRIRMRPAGNRCRSHLPTFLRATTAMRQMLTQKPPSFVLSNAEMSTRDAAQSLDSCPPAVYRLLVP